MNTKAPSPINSATRLRAEVAQLLFQILENGKSSREILPLAQAHFESTKDRAWLQECFFGCLRDLPKLQHWLRLLLDKPLRKEDKIIEHLLMQGFYQLASMRTPDHAAISESVNAARALQRPKLAGMVNAVMRNFLRQDIAVKPVDSEHITYGLPKWLLKKLKNDYPEDWRYIAEQIQQKAPMFLRINSLQTSVHAYSDKLNQANIAHTIITERAIKLTQSHVVTELPDYAKGAFSVQDLAAQLAADYLDAQAGDEVLDCCAAPGGKTAAIVERTPTIQGITAIDIQADRMHRMRDNFARLALPSDKVCLLQDDASEYVKLLPQQQFDRILLDAPCSATGIIRRHPDIKWLRKSADIDNLLDLQAKILHQTWQRLKEGGTLLYATCSILRDENSRQIEAFLRSCDDAEHIALDQTEALGRQILPGENEMDGFYYAKLQKRRRHS